MRTQVAIIGAGPASLLLAHALRQAGIDCIVLERRDRAYVESRVRAGVLEQGTVELLSRLGLDGRLRREALTHDGVSLVCDGEPFRIDFAALTGRRVTVYGQQEVMKDLFDAAEAVGLPIAFEADVVQLHDIETGAPFVTWRRSGAEHRVDCEIIAGCDGFHGVSRRAIPAAARQLFERDYPFGWLGVLADVPPCAAELIYCSHARGFALASMRSPTRSRYYLQCALDDPLEAWPDSRFWDELSLRIGPETAARIVRGASFEKSIAPLRSAVTEPMRWGRLVLAGDAAHIVPPTGAKGLNLAASDVGMLSAALVEYFDQPSERALDRYSERALARVWKAARFSWWFTSLTHRFPQTDAFDRRLQLAELAYLRSSTAAQTAFAENYVGLPLA
jgi:p-hydroxybenzoate 3-monooxygenase